MNSEHGAVRPAWAVAADGVWRSNPALAMMLGLCPLLAVSTTLVTGVVLGACTAITLLLSGGLISAARGHIPQSVRLPAFVVIVASCVTAVDIALSGLAYELHTKLGLFLPLIVTNCVILARAEAFASRQPLRLALLDAFGMGAGFALVLAVLGALRELLAFGTLGRGMELLVPGWMPGVALLHAEGNPGVLLAATPPGAFLLLALLVAARNLLRGRAEGTAASPSASQAAE